MKNLEELTKEELIELCKELKKKSELYEFTQKGLQAFLEVIVTSLIKSPTLVTQIGSKVFELLKNKFTIWK